MNRITETFDKILIDIKAKVPAILQKEKLKNFEYGLGYPSDQSKLFCAVRFSKFENDYKSETLEFTIHLQFVIKEEEAYRYIDCVREYLQEMRPLVFDFHTAEYKIEMEDSFNARNLQVFFDVTMVRQLDDCR